MKKLMMLALGGLLVGSFAFAADEENTTSTTVDKSHNPLTGSDTTTKETKHKVKDAAGKHKVKKKESTTHKTDGGVDKKTTKEESNTPAD